MRAKLLVVPVALAVGLAAACADDEVVVATTGTGTGAGTGTGSLPPCAEVGTDPICVECINVAGMKDCNSGDEEVFCYYDPDRDVCEEEVA
jgi:hypothetical protein